MTYKIIVVKDILIVVLVIDVFVIFDFVTVFCAAIFGTTVLKVALVILGVVATALDGAAIIYISVRIPTIVFTNLFAYKEEKESVRFV